MKKLYIYVDASVIGGCEDSEFADEEDKGLSWEEKREKTRKLLKKDPLWLRLKGRLIEPTKFSTNGIQIGRAQSP